MISRKQTKEKEELLRALPSVLLFVLVCFFGLFFFPIASFILGRADEKYFMFGAMTFAWGLIMIMQSTSGYLNMWITDGFLPMGGRYRRFFVL